MKNLPVVISASRMTDMPAFYPEHIIREVEVRKAKGLVIHTIVLWTKHIASIFKDPLYNYLREQQRSGTQIYVQLTLTGIGNQSYIITRNQKKVFLEPCTPALSESLPSIDRLIEFTGNPERIRLRVDPLIRLKYDEEKIFSNYDELEKIIRLLQPKGIRHFTFSFLENGVYKKIDNRFQRHELEILPPSSEERQKMAEAFGALAKTLNVTITSCSVPRLPTSACIDGNLLQKLHPLNLPLNLSQPHSRDLCNCTKSIDIGGWPPKICNSGCLYCYSVPDLKFNIKDV